MRREWLACRVRNLLVAKYGSRPLYDITVDGLLEVHTGGWHDKLAAVGFTYVRDGYFSSIWRLPDELLK